MKEAVDPEKFRRLLDSRPSERELQAYLRRHPWVLYWTLCGAAGHSGYVLPQFPLSDRYKTDFVIINSYSGAFEVFFVELEPSTSRPFNRLGTPSKRLAGAVKQVDDWRSHFEAFRDETRAALVRWAEKRDILGYHTGSRPFNYFGQRLADWDAPILDHYVIIVGRSSELSPEERYLSGRFARGHSVQVISYDRLLHLAERRYGDTSQKH